jgi:hypothetical protein
MKWDSFCRILVEADSKFRQMPLDLPQYQNFINKSSLIISLGSVQVPFKKEMTVSDLKSISIFLIDSDFKDNLLCLFNAIERLEDEQKAMVRQKEREGMKEIAEKLTRTKNELSTFPLNELVIQDDIDIQIIFPGVNMDAIQAFKRHPLINTEKTCLCRACIRVFLF